MTDDLKTRRAILQDRLDRARAWADHGVMDFTIETMGSFPRSIVVKYLEAQLAALHKTSKSD